MVILCKYEGIYKNLFSRECVSDGLIAAKLDGKLGYINLKDKVVIPFKYDYASLL